MPEPSPTDLQLVAEEWLRRVVAEYRSAALTHQLTHWLIQVAAPLELIRDGARIVEDELVHSELSHAVYLAAGGKQEPKMPRDTLALAPTSGRELEHAITGTCVEMFCLGETVAVRLFSRLREDCEVGEAKTALDRVLKDEVRHRDFGWKLFDWIASSDYAPNALAQVKETLPDMFRRLQRNYSYARLDDATERSQIEAQWGLMPPGYYARALEETFRRDYRPLFAEFEIDAEQAWQAARAT